MAKPAGRRGRPAHPDILTPAEWRVLWLVQHGLSDRQIARMRGTSLEAVKFHRRNIAGKLDVGGRRALRYWRRDASLVRVRGDVAMDEVRVSPRGVGQISIETREVERAVEFYRDTVGLTHLYTFSHPTGMLAFLECGGVRLFLSSHDDRTIEKSSVIYFTVGDIQATYAAFSARGVAFEGAPHLIHRHESGIEEWMAFFRDPDDNLLALMSEVQPAG